MHTIRLIIAGAVCGVTALLLGFSTNNWRVDVVMAVCFVAGGVCAELSAHEIEAASKPPTYFRDHGNRGGDCT